MSAAVVQKVLVRMHYDPAFVQRIHKKPEETLKGLDLSAQEKSWILQADRRAFQTDPHRRSRSLVGLLEEFPATCALFLPKASGMKRLEAFFSSPEFHRMVMERGSMAFAFADYLQRLAAGHRSRQQVLRLERSLAQLRRQPQRVLPSQKGSSGSASFCQRAPGVEVCEVGIGTLAVYQALRNQLARLHSSPPQALLNSRWKLQKLPGISQDAGEHLLLLRDPKSDDITLEEISASLAGLLSAASPARPWSELEALALQHGAEPGEEAEILQELLEDRLLVALEPADEPGSKASHSS